MNIVILGAQGTGKGTVAEIIEKETGWPQISTGEIFRKNIQENTPLGMIANEYIAKGNLVPDDITVPMVISRLENDDAQKGWILDGFPRTMAQAEMLDKILAEKKKKIDVVMNLISPREENMNRILTRRVCSNPDCKATYNVVMRPPKVEGICDKCGAPLVQREDDSSEEAIYKRLSIYEEQTVPVIDYYQKKGILRTEVVSTKTNHLGEDIAHEFLEGIKR